MSTSPYALDLRKKVISYLNSGRSQRSCAEVFDLHVATIHRWWKRYKTEGHVSPRQRLGSKGKVDPEALVLYVNSHPEQTLKEIGCSFGVSDVAILQRLKSLGFSYKKKRLPMWKQTKRRERPIKSL